MGPIFNSATCRNTKQHDTASPFVKVMKMEK
jgi:hypothetical protein